MQDPAVVGKGLLDLPARDGGRGFVAGHPCGCEDFDLLFFRFLGFFVAATFTFGHGFGSPERCRIGGMPDGSLLSENQGCLRGFQGDDPFGSRRVGLLGGSVGRWGEWCKWVGLRIAPEPREGASPPPVGAGRVRSGCGASGEGR